MSLPGRIAARAAGAVALLGVAACAPRPAAPAPPPPGRFGPVTDARESSPLLGGGPNTTVLAIDAGVAGDRVSALMEVPGEQCAIVIARGGPSIEDLDLLAYGEDGSVVGTDEKPDKTPVLLICPPHPARVWIAARIAAGHGLVAVGAQRVAQGDAGRAAAIYGIHDAGEASSARAAGWPGLDESIAAHRRDIGGAWQDVRRVAIPLDARLPSRVSAQVDADRCLDIFVAPSEEVGQVELTVQDSGGAIIGRAASTGRERAIVVCSPLEAALSIELRPQSGRGTAVLALSRTRPGSEAELDGDVTRVEAFPERDTEAELESTEKELAERNAYGKGKRLPAAALELGKRMSQSLTLPAGCSRLDVVGGRPLRGLEAWLWSSGGELVSHAEGPARLALFACGAGGAYRLDSQATLRAGPHAVLIHSESELPGALVKQPLAASRLLAHVVASGVLRRPSEIGQVTEFSLSDSELKSIDLTVPFGRCVDVALALGRDGIGAEVRLVSAASGTEIAFGRGAHAASARVCSLEAGSAEANLKTRAELRIASGAGPGLVATRMLSPKR